VSHFEGGNYALKGGDFMPLPDKIENLENLVELENREDEFEGEIIPLDENLAKALIKALEERRSTIDNRKAG
jgi:hypothetical protein